MKKTYMQPSMEVVNVKAETLICASVEVPVKSDPFEEGMAIETNERLFGDFQPEVFSFLW